MIHHYICEYGTTQYVSDTFFIYIMYHEVDNNVSDTIRLWKKGVSKLK